MSKLSLALSSTRTRSSRVPVVGGAFLAVAVAGVVALGMIAPAAASAETCPERPEGTIGFHGTQSGGTININGRANAEGVGGTISCGILYLVEPIHFTIAAEDVKYNPYTLKLLGFLPLESTLTVDGPAEGELSAHEYINANGEEATGLNTSFTAPVTSTVNFLGIAKCSIGPFAVSETTGKSGKLEGHFLEGEILTGEAGKLVGNEFAVPAIQASKTCPFFLSALTNFILGLPAKAGASTVTSNETFVPNLEEE
jgi:hypothetical protein